MAREETTILSGSRHLQHREVEWLSLWQRSYLPQHSTPGSKPVCLHEGQTQPGSSNDKAASDYMSAGHRSVPPEVLGNCTRGPQTWQHHGGGAPAIATERGEMIYFGVARHVSAVHTGVCVQTTWYRAPGVMLHIPFNEAINTWYLGLVAVKLAAGYPLSRGDGPRHVELHRGNSGASQLSMCWTMEMKQAITSTNSRPGSSAGDSWPLSSLLIRRGFYAQDMSLILAHVRHSTVMNNAKHLFVPCISILTNIYVCSIIWIEQFLLKLNENS